MSLDTTAPDLADAVTDLPEVEPPPSEPVKRTTTGRRKTAKKAPAKKAPSAPAAAPAERPPATMGRPTNKAKLEKTLADQLMTLGLGISGIGVVSGNGVVAQDGVIVTEHAEPVAKALADLADTNPKIRKFLEKGVESTGWVGVALAVGGLTKAIVSNHVAARPEPEPEPGPDGWTNPFDRVPVTGL